MLVLPPNILSGGGCSGPGVAPRPDIRSWGPLSAPPSGRPPTGLRTTGLARHMWGLRTAGRDPRSARADSRSSGGGADRTTAGPDKWSAGRPQRGRAECGRPEARHSGSTALRNPEVRTPRASGSAALCTPEVRSSARADSRLCGLVHPGGPYPVRMAARPGAAACTLRTLGLRASAPADARTPAPRTPDVGTPSLRIPAARTTARRSAGRPGAGRPLSGRVCSGHALALRSSALRASGWTPRPQPGRLDKPDGWSKSHSGTRTCDLWLCRLTP